MKIARFYVGSYINVGVLDLEARYVLRTYFEGMTVTSCLGYWKGVAEDSTVFEVVTSLSASKLYAIAKKLETACKQEKVLCVITKCDTNI